MNRNNFSYLMDQEQLLAFLSQSFVSSTAYTMSDLTSIRVAVFPVQGILPQNFIKTLHFLKTNCSILQTRNGELNVSFVVCQPREIAEFSCFCQRDKKLKDKEDWIYNQQKLSESVTVGVQPVGSLQMTPEEQVAWAHQYQKCLTSVQISQKTFLSDDYNSAQSEIYRFQQSQYDSFETKQSTQQVIPTDIQAACIPNDSRMLILEDMATHKIFPTKISFDAIIGIGQINLEEQIEQLYQKFSKISFVGMEKFYWTENVSIDNIVPKNMSALLTLTPENLELSENVLKRMIDRNIYINQSECIQDIVNNVYKDLQIIKIDSQQQNTDINQLKQFVYFNDYVYPLQRYSLYEQFYVPDIYGPYIINRLSHGYEQFSINKEVKLQKSLEIVVPTRKTIGLKQLIARKALEEGIKLLKLKQFAASQESLLKAYQMSHGLDFLVQSLSKYYIIMIKYHDLNDKNIENLLDEIKQVLTELMHPIQLNLVSMQSTIFLSLLQLLFDSYQICYIQKYKLDVQQLFYSIYSYFLQTICLQSPSFFRTPQIVHVVCKFDLFLQKQKKYLTLFAFKSMFQKHLLSQTQKWIVSDISVEEQNTLLLFIGEMRLFEISPNDVSMFLTANHSANQYFKLQFYKLLNIFNDQFYTLQGFNIPQFGYQNGDADSDTIAIRKQTKKSKNFSVKFSQLNALSQNAFFFKNAQLIQFKGLMNKISITQKIFSRYEQIDMDQTFILNSQFLLQKAEGEQIIEVNNKKIDKIPKIFAEKTFNIQLYLRPIHVLAQFYSSLVLQSIVLIDSQASCDVLTHYFEPESSSLMIEAIIHNYDTRLNAILFNIDYLIVNLSGVTIKIPVKQNVLQLNRYVDFKVNNIRTVSVDESVQSFNLNRTKCSADEQRVLNQWNNNMKEGDFTILQFNLGTTFVNNLKYFHVNTDSDFLVLREGQELSTLSSKVSSSEITILVKIALGEDEARNMNQQQVKVNFENQKVFMLLDFHNYSAYIRNSRNNVPLYHINHGYLVQCNNLQKQSAALNSNGELINIIQPAVSQQLVFAENKFQVNVTDEFQPSMTKQLFVDELAHISEKNLVVSKAVEDGEHVAYVRFDETLQKIVKDHQMSIQVVELNCLLTSDIIYQKTEEFRVVVFGDASLQFVFLSSGVSLKKLVEVAIPM